MSYVNSLSLKGHIPDFSSGKRVFNTEKDAVNIGGTVVMRDPIRASMEKRDNGLHSPHEDGFRILYLDTHAQVVKRLDFNHEL